MAGLVSFFFFFNLYPIFIWGLSVSPMQTEEREFSAKNIPSIISNQKTDIFLMFS